MAGVFLLGSGAGDVSHPSETGHEASFARGVVRTHRPRLAEQ